MYRNKSTYPALIPHRSRSFEGLKGVGKGGVDFNMAAIIVFAKVPFGGLYIPLGTQRAILTPALFFRLVGVIFVLLLAAHR